MRKFGLETVKLIFRRSKFANYYNKEHKKEFAIFDRLKFSDFWPTFLYRKGKLFFWWSVVRDLGISEKFTNEHWYTLLNNSNKKNHRVAGSHLLYSALFYKNILLFGCSVSSLSRIPKVRGSTPPLVTLGNVSENLFLGSTQAL